MRWFELAVIYASVFGGILFVGLFLAANWNVPLRRAARNLAISIAFTAVIAAACFAAFAVVIGLLIWWLGPYLNA